MSQDMLTVYQFYWDGGRERVLDPRDYADSAVELRKAAEGVEYMAALGRKDDDCSVEPKSISTF